MSRILFYILPMVLTINVFAQNDYLIKNISVIPMDEEKVLSDYDVYLKNGLIAEISKNMSITSDSIETIDGAGKYLIPGLCDMHLHFWSDSTVLGLYLANGVTAVRSASGKQEYLNWSSKISNNQMEGPMLFVTTPLINDVSFIKDFIPEEFYLSLKKSKDVPQYAGEEVFLVTELTDMVEPVANFKKAGFCSLKPYSSLTKKEFKNLCLAADKYKMKVSGHLPWQVPLDSAIYWGMDELMHLEELRFQFYKNLENGIKNAMIDTTGLDEIAKKLAANKISVTTTISLNWSFIDRNKDEEAYFERPEMKYLYPKTYNFYKENNGHPNYPEHELELLKQILMALNKNNVNIVLGTDAQGMRDVHGFTVHDEIALLVENGLTPFEALETGTVNAAKTMEQNDWGIIKENFRANLVILDKNPLENIENTKNIVGVFKDGNYYSKDDLTKKMKDIYNYRQNNDRLITPMEGR